MMYEMEEKAWANRLNGSPPLHHVGLVWETLAFADAVLSGEIDCSSAKYYSSDWDSYPSPQGYQPRDLTNWAISTAYTEP